MEDALAPPKDMLAPPVGPAGGMLSGSSNAITPSPSFGIIIYISF